MRKLSRSCVLFLWTCTLTFVKSQDCTLDQFIYGPLYDQNFDTTEMSTSYAGGKQIRVSCNVGYAGFFKLICVEGKWQARGTKCQPKSCGHPGDAQFADFHLEKGDDFVFGSQVVYTCHKGYQMVSRKNYRTCMAEGWDGVVPVCEAQQCPVIHVANNVNVIGDPEEATYGNVVRFSCKSSTEILYGATEVYCDETGEWSDRPPYCEAVQCKVPVIEHGRVTGEIRDYNEHEILRFECNPRYKSTEERPSKCTKIGQRADWSPTPACEPIKCRLTLPPLEGTTYEPAYRNVFTPDETLRVTCGENYWISTPREASAVITCKIDGEWTINPICKEVTCNRPYNQPIYHWNTYWGQKITLGDTVTYSCRSGYKSPDGANRATCTRGGWSPDPLCQEIICDRHDIPNAVNENIKEKYKNNEWAYYVCKEGYTGRFTLTCTERGWNQYPQCTEITCKPDFYRNADIVDRKTIYKYREQAEYNCRGAYKGGFTLTCTERGWTGSAQCTEITCDRQDIPNTVIENIKEKYKFNEQVNYVCSEGYTGHFTLTCSNRGWVGRPQCTEVTCDLKTYDYADIVNRKQTYKYEEQAKYKCKGGDTGGFSLTCTESGWTGKPQCTECEKPEFPHGFIVGPSNQSIYYYTCNEGYKLLTKGWWGTAKCNGSVWSGLQQCIENTTCGLPDIPNGKVTPQLNNYKQGQSVQIRCNHGYNAEVDNLTCHEGKWPNRLEEICTLIASHCNPPPKVENAVIITSYQQEYLSGSEVTYQCRDTYTMEGPDTITCKNGIWQELNINCIFVSCEPPPDGLIIQDLPEKDGPILPDHVIEISCPKGKRLNGSSVLICGTNGQWNSSFPTCEVSCEPPPDGLIIQGLPENDGPILPDHVIEISCPKGKRLNGSSVLICGTNGQWDSSFPTCEVSCEPPPDGLIIQGLPENDGPILPDHVIEIGCPRGKRLNGNSVLNCGTNGQWDSSFPTCEGNCSVIGVPEGVQIKQYQPGDKLNKGERITFSCLPGYFIQGSKIVKCLANRLWSHPFPTCKRRYPVD